MSLASKVRMTLSVGMVLPPRLKVILLASVTPKCESPSAISSSLVSRSSAQVITPFLKFFVRCGDTVSGMDTSRFWPPLRTEYLKLLAFRALPASTALKNSTSIEPSRRRSQRVTLPKRSQPSFLWNGVSDASFVCWLDMMRIRGFEGMGCLS